MKVLLAAAVAIAASFTVSEQARAHGNVHSKTGLMAPITTFATSGGSGSGGDGGGGTGGGGTGGGSGTGPAFSMETKITSPTSTDFWFGLTGPKDNLYYDTIPITRTSTHKITVTNDSQTRTVTVYPDAGLYNGSAIIAPDWTNANPWTVTLAAGRSLSLSGTATYTYDEGGFQVPRTPATYGAAAHAVTGISAAWQGGSVTVGKNSGDLTHGTIDATFSYTIWLQINKRGHGTGTGQ